MAKAFRHGKSVVLDRCNVHRKERKMWMNYASQESGVTRVEFVWMDPGVDVCKERVSNREGHETLSPEDGDEVIEKFIRGTTEIVHWEGQAETHYVTNEQESREVLALLSGYDISTKRFLE
eukprot:TRINITY_DN5495_c0_g1_i3.p1 TRINITY_DN5495_c0_g1~~TRINITY_DN5495_c0_g1_i3.p1  ORF type:complete len:121 (-),score=30.22 TRINITY_DN5495_c0_g1_i3:36-398(-)